MSYSKLSEQDLTPAPNTNKLMTDNERKLIATVKHLIELCENNSAEYRDLERARKLVFSIENPPLPQDQAALRTE